MNTLSSSDRFIAYFRVSTARQGRSGLGIDAQKNAVAAYLIDRRPLAEFVEIESGRKSDRPMLAQALAACRVHRAVLVIAKLDRLARNVSFVSALMDAGVEFVACDFPQANRLTIHILAAVAEHEARMISERTRVALAAAKARGRVLGGFRGRAGTSLPKRGPYGRLKPIAEPPTLPLRSASFGPTVRFPCAQLQKVSIRKALRLVVVASGLPHK
jgi:DNA invertase Pin-like site-specific DNA recombinase